jgi:hypothetical protein
VIVVPGIGMLYGLPVFVARRWGTSAMIGVVVASLLVAIVADRVLFRISLINDCELEHSFPYDVSGCD